MRIVRITLAVLLAGAGTVVAAGPAAADHLVIVSPSSCGAGIFTGDFPGDVTTGKVRVHHRKDGTIEATCHFTGFPRSAYLPDVDVLWERPTDAVVSRVTGCQLSHELDPAGEIGIGDGTLKLTPGGTGQVRCVFARP